MALRLFTPSLRPKEFGRAVAAFSASEANKKNTKLPMPKIEPKNLFEREAVAHEERYRNELITVSVPQDISKINGVPVEHIKSRRVRIYKCTKNAMQSGTDNVGIWQLDFETRPRWENPLMGWASTGDPLSNMRVQFANKDEAIDFASKNGWEWFVDEGTQVRAKTKSYSFNFSWNKRSRVSTK